ncbi:DUF3618 domain-containing protein [Rhizobium helianthi]|uniref:DUF3618 domain-containing protein n=1 Tax=Rhizobium helianthi TaxID=1132695 RepID=A0ABW4LZM8_9HYPH
MSYTSDARPEEIEREIEKDRERIGAKLDEIQSRMSPGQLIDEALSYAKSSGGGEFLSNFTTSMKTNPIPVALMGVSLAWLMSGQKAAPGADTHETEHPLAPVTGPVRRTGPVQQDGMHRYSHFTDETGSRFKALTDETGRRAGHFTDEAGRSYRGFADKAGRQMHDIRDETGKLFDEASGWIAASWRDLKHSAARAGRHVTEAGRSAGKTSMDMGASMRDSAHVLNETIMRQFRDQPLVGGALAFAVGAAIGAVLPRTDREDEMMGETADQVKGKMATQASSAMDRAETVATDVSRSAAAVASDVHAAAKDRITEEARQFKPKESSTQPSRPH